MVTDSENNVQTISTVVAEDGTYRVEVETPLADGSYNVVANVSDKASNTASATDLGSVDSKVSIEVNAPDVTSDTTPQITGKTDAEPGQVVTIVITDSAGNVQTISNTVKADGTFCKSPPKPLAEGPYTVEVTVTDKAGNTAKATDKRKKMKELLSVHVEVLKISIF